MNRREFIEAATAAGAASIFGGCTLPRWTKGKFALNASTLRTYGLTLDEQVRAAVAGGFSGFEPWLKDVRAAKSAGRLKDTVAFARDNGLSFVNGIAFGQWTNPDARVRTAGLDETRRDMELLAEMGCPYIAASMFGIQKPGSPTLSIEEIAERFRAVCAIGDETGVKPLLEYWGHSVNLNTLEDALDVLKKCGRDDAAILADVYHTYRGGSRFGAFASLKAAQLPVLHVNDYSFAKPRTSLVDADRVWQGDGSAPWRSLFKTLDYIGAQPWLSVELFNPQYCQTTPCETARTAVRKFDGLEEKNALRLGVQMWSVNDLWRKDPAGAFRRLRSLGYEGVQSLGFYRMDWGELERMLDGEGLRIVDMPFNAEMLATEGGFSRFVDFCKRFDVGFVFDPWVDPKGMDEGKWRKRVARVSELRKRFAAVGIRTGFHNHQVELTAKFADGTCPLDAFEAAGVDFELDVGHVKLAGGDPVKWLQRLAGRVPSIHAKPGGGRAVGDADDRNDWGMILPEAAASGVKWAIVECETRRDTFDDVTESANYLKGIM